MQRLIPLALLLCGFAAFASEPHSEQYSAAVRSLIAPNPRHRLHDASALNLFVGDVMAASAEAPDVDTWTILTVAFNESSFNPHARGKLSEIGIMQIHGVARQGCDLRTQRGQLVCGARLLQDGFEQCGSMAGSLTRYATGRCKTKSDRVKRIVNYRLRMAERLRKEFER